MRTAGGFGQAVLGGAGQGVFDRIVKTAHMPRGDEQRFYIRSCPHHGTDFFVPVIQPFKAALLGLRFVIRSGQPAFGTADGRGAQK